MSITVFYLSKWLILNLQVHSFKIVHSEPGILCNAIQKLRYREHHWR
jgi:hypothetical protein